MAINYTYDPVINGVTDADEGYMNHMQDGLKKACDGVDEINERLFTQVQDNIDGRNVFNNHKGLSIFKVTTNIRAPKETIETYFVEVIRDEKFITQKWISVSDSRMWIRTCDINNSWLWTSFDELTNQREETSFNFAGETFYLKRVNEVIQVYANGSITENISEGWTSNTVQIPDGFRPRTDVNIHLTFLYGKHLTIKIDTEGQISIFAPQEIIASDDKDKWTQTSATYLR